MPALTQAQLNLLGASSGAFSVVTHREATGDRSITLDQFEKAVLSQKYSLEKFKRRGGAIEDGLPERWPFYMLTPSNLMTLGTQELSIVYPKSEGNELRLYMNTSNGFGCNPNDYFIIFNRQADPCSIVGFISSENWDNFWLSRSRIVDQRFSILNQDPDDVVYQQEVLLTQAGGLIQQTRMLLPRDPRIAKQAIESSNYQCEFDSSHISFTSPVTSRQYMEAHHLIPMSHHQYFAPYSLDVACNVVSLCPTCHKKIHLGLAQDKRNMLYILYSKRAHVLNSYRIDFETLCSFYNA